MKIPNRRTDAKVSVPPQYYRQLAYSEGSINEHYDQVTKTCHHMHMSLSKMPLNTDKLTLAVLSVVVRPFPSKQVYNSEAL